MSALTLFPKRIREPKKMERLEMEAFDRLSQMNYRRWTRPLIDNIKQRTGLQKGRIIDIACGPGLLSKELATSNRRFEITGIDFSKDALRIAKRNTRGLKNVRFVRSSVYALPFKDDTFDLVVCKDSFHHFDNPVAALKEMVRVVRPGGFVYIHDMRRDLPSYLIKRSLGRKNLIEKLQYYSTRAAYTKSEVRTMLRKLKLSPLQLETPIITPSMRKTYPKFGIRIPELKEGLEARYNLLVRKPRAHGISSTL